MPSRNQTGQALPLGIGLTAIICALLLAYVNNAHVAIEKMRLSNAADAAAYSALQRQARALNFQAYTNRAMVANQVAMAQAVSLRSWSLYGVVAAENAHSTIGNIPVVNAVTGAVETTMQAASRVIAPVSDAIAGVVDQVNGALSDAQQAMFLSALASVPETVSDIVEASDPRFSAESAYTLASMASTLGAVSAFTTRTDDSQSARMQSRVDMINRSLDPFSRNRDWRFFNFWLPTSPFTWVRLQRQGTTRLVIGDAAEGETAYEWKARDGLSLMTKIWRPFRGVKQVEMPVGWGEALFNQAGSRRSIESPLCTTRNVGVASLEQCEGHWLPSTPRAESLANQRAPGIRGSESQAALRGTYHGVRGFRALSDDALASDTPSLLLAVEVGLDAEQLPDTGSRVTGRFAGHRDSVSRYSSLAMAEVYYEHPSEEHAHAQHVNSYSPYWDVRLVRVPDTHRAAISALRLSELSPSGSLVSAPGATGKTVAADATASLATTTAASLFESSGNIQLPTLDAYVEEAARELAGVDDLIDQAESMLEDSATALLSGAVASKTGVDVAALTDSDRLDALGQTMLDDALAGTGVPVDALRDQLAATCASALGEAQRLQAEFARVRNAVVSEYDAAKAAAMAEIGDTQAAFQAEINALRETLAERAMSEDDQRALHDRIAVLVNEQRVAAESYPDLLAERLVTIVSDATDVYPMTHAFALSVVQADLTLDRDVNESLGVSDVLDDHEEWHCD